MKQKVIKRSLAIILSFVLLLATIPMVFATQVVNGTIGTFEWSYDNNGTLTLGGTGAMPDSIRWSSADKVPWHEYASSISTVTLGSGITTIGNFAFAGLVSLRSITIPSNIQTIEGSAFEGCTGLRSVTFSEGLKEIGDRAFYGCAELSGVLIPESVESIGTQAFKNCRSLQEITIKSRTCDISASDIFDEGIVLRGFDDAAWKEDAERFGSFAPMTESEVNSLSFSERIRAFFSSLIPTLTSVFSRILDASSQLFQGQGESTTPGASPAETTFANLVPYLESLFRNLVSFLQGMPA